MLIRRVLHIAAGCKWKCGTLSRWLSRIRAASRLAGHHVQTRCCWWHVAASPGSAASPASSVLCLAWPLNSHLNLVVCHCSLSLYVQSGVGSCSYSVASPVVLQATYSPQAEWQYDPPGTAVDAQGALLLSPYQQVSVRASVKSTSARDSRWYLTLQNVALWMNEPLQYHLRVRDTPAAPGNGHRFHQCW